MLTADDFKDLTPHSEYVVTIEQLIMNVLNIYVGLLGNKPEILEYYGKGKILSNKTWKDVQTDNIDLQKGSSSL